MPDSSLSEHLAQAQTRMANLRQRAGFSLLHQQGLLPDAFEELHTTIEELRVAEEEMCAQNDDLIATRQRVEAEQHRYRDLFEFAPDGYLVTSMDGTILEANRAASQLLNVAPRFLRNRLLPGFVYQEDLGEFHARLVALQSAPSLAAPQEWMLRLRRRSAAPFHAALTIAPGKPLLQEPFTLRWIVRDITERKQWEEERLALAKEQAARAEAEAGRRQVTAILETITDTFVTLDSRARAS